MKVESSSSSIPMIALFKRKQPRLDPLFILSLDYTRDEMEGKREGRRKEGGGEEGEEREVGERVGRGGGR